MKLGIGTKAGLTVGFIYILFYVMLLVVSIIPILGYISFILLEIFVDGYLRHVLYRNFLQLHRMLRQSTILYSNLYTQVEFIPIYAIFVILLGISFGKIFQKIYSKIPVNSNTLKSLIYGFLIWLCISILALLFPSFLWSFSKTLFYIIYADPEYLIIHALNIFYWLLYGFLLGKFYDAFSKEPDAGIFYMIKKVLLRKS